MANKIMTVFQNLDKAISGNWESNSQPKPSHINSYDMPASYQNQVVYKAKDKEDYLKNKLELQQNAYLNSRWQKANVDLTVQAFTGLNNIKLMYRDAELMDSFPEIGAALDIVAEESCCLSDKGSVVNVYSKSDRVKNVLEDLFTNRLDLQITAPMIIRAMCKYGNQFMLLDIDNKMGIKGWRQLPVYHVERLENGVENPYSAQGFINGNPSTTSDMSTKFMWVDANNSSQIPFRNWQVGHFRLLSNSLYLPYGCLVGDTRVETEYGYKEISKLQIGDKVWTFNVDTQQRELADVTMWMNKGKKDVYSVYTKYHEIHGTSDHKLLSYSDGQLVYKEIGELKVGDFLVCDNLHERNSRQIKIDKSELKDFEKGKKSIHWWTDYIDNIPEYYDEDFARLFGFLMGDGWLSRGYHVMFALGEYQTLNDKYISLIEKFSGKKMSFVPQKKNSKRKLPYHSAFVGSKMLYTILKRSGFNGDCYTKRIPSWVFESSNSIKEAFLDGLMDADGHLHFVSKQTIAYNIELANKGLVQDVKTLVSSLGYKCGKICSRNRIGQVSSFFDNEKPVVIRHASYYVNFYKKLNTPLKKTDIINWKNDGYILEEIKKINYYGNEETFDITVSNENSNFFANGVVTHNCSYLNNARRHWRMLSLMEDMMLIYRLERSIERRVYKIFVGAIDDADVKAYVEDIANNFKRTPIIDPETGQVDLRKNLLPVRKNTPIPLLDGRTITIEELAKEYENGKTNYVYSVQDKTHKIVPGKVVWCGKNYTADKLYRITLDDDTYFDLAGEHELIMRDGSKKRADEAMIGESVMPFYRKVDKNSDKLFDRYEKVYNPHSSKYEFTHRMIAESVEKEDDAYNTVHHKDFNKYNNEPNNLLWCDYHEHHKMHSELAKSMWADKDKLTIKNIEVIEGDDVYCMTVVGLNDEEDRHNFALCTFANDGSVCQNGMFVSNCVDQDIFIPVRDPSAPTPIDTLSAAQNLTAMDDIKFVQNKVLTALRIPRTFLNFDEAVGDGKNLALMDIRFTRTVNRIQQAFLMELTKIASIHLYIMGFDDELTNFTLSMNNPSTQAEQLEIENIEKKITAVRDAVADPGNGIPIMSLTRALKEIMKWSEKDIQDNFEELRLEKAIAAELEKTTQIIKKTGIFDTVDRMYGEPGAEYQEDQQGMGGDDPMGGGGPGGGAPMGGDMPPMDGGPEGELDGLGAPGAEEEGDIAGNESEMPMGDEQPMEGVQKDKPLLTEAVVHKTKPKMDKFAKRNETIVERAQIYDDALLINEEFNKMIDSLGDFITEKKDS